MTVAEHGGALEYDLMTRTRFTLDDLGGELPTRALLAFVMHLPPDSALSSEVRGDTAQERQWQEPSLLPMLVADLADAAHAIAWEVAQANSSHDLRGVMPEPIERPGVTPRRETRRWGADAIPVSDFDSWWNGGPDGQQ